MADQKLRMAIAARAATLMYTREESEYFSAKRKAARERGVNPTYQPHDLPSNAEIRERLLAYAELMEGPARRDVLRDMRLEALSWMHRLVRFKPHLIGSVLTGHVRKGSDIDLHVFSNSLEAVTAVLDEERVDYTVERKRVVKHHVERVYRHVHVAGKHPIELTTYRADEVNYPFRSSITGQRIERADVAEVISLIEREHPGAAPARTGDDAADEAANEIDVAFMYRLLLEPLAGVAQSPKHHPEGDALTHSLQVFLLALADAPHDSELLGAALLHDVGKAIDPQDHVAAGLEALDGLVSDRTAWLIEHHMLAHRVRDRTIGHRALARLVEHPDFEDLMRLEAWDRGGRRRGVRVPGVEDAVARLVGGA